MALTRKTRAATPAPAKTGGLGAFFRRAGWQVRGMPLAEMIASGDALMAKASAHLQKNGNAPVILNEALVSCRAAAAKYYDARKKARRLNTDDLKPEIRAKRAECHLEMGRLYEMLGKKQKAREHYRKARDIACFQLREGNEFDDRTRQAGKIANEGMDRVDPVTASARQPLS